MLEPEQLAELTLSQLTANRVLAGQRVVVSAGPTRERLDPVRFISNRSSGKMGYAIAQAARDAGATVILVSGPVSIDPPSGVEFVSVESAQQMYDAVQRVIAGADIYIGAAAVADYRAPAVAAQKIKKSSEKMQLELVKAPDILASVAALKTGRPFVVGFAAETENVEERARAKLVQKRVDMIAANQVGDSLAFDRDENSLLVLWADGCEEIAHCGKPELARRLVALIAEVRRSRRGAGAVAAVRG
jgi:phosphopantothenoylcysteine decarboxylase/phosphopantothenate--cysteine ligase